MHVHAPSAQPHARRRLLAALAVTATLTLMEAAGGYLSGSLALWADAGHMLTDLLALLVAYGAVTVGARPADDRRTYGYRRLEVLGALINSVALVVVSGSIAFEAWQRWLTPRPVALPIMFGIATAGLFANLLGLWLLGGHTSNINLRSAFMHVLGDALSSVGVLLGGVIIGCTGWTRVDALLSLAISGVIAAGCYNLLREVVDVLLESAPRGIDTPSVRRTIREVEGVADVHDLHVWSITSGVAALSAHVVLRRDAPSPEVLLSAIGERLRQVYGIEHTTLQLEPSTTAECSGCV